MLSSITAFHWRHLRGSLKSLNIREKIYLFFGEGGMELAEEKLNYFYGNIVISCFYHKSCAKMNLFSINLFPLLHLLPSEYPKLPPHWGVNYCCLYPRRIKPFTVFVVSLWAASAVKCFLMFFCGDYVHDSFHNETSPRRIHKSKIAPKKYCSVCISEAVTITGTCASAVSTILFQDVAHSVML